MAKNGQQKERQRKNLMKVPGIDLALADNLIENSLFTLGVLSRASDEELLAIPGIDQMKLQAIRDRCAGK